MSQLMRTVEIVIKALVDWLVRRRLSPALLFVRSGVLLVLGSIGSGWLINMTIDAAGQSLSFGPDSSSGVTAVLPLGVFAVGVVLIIIGVFWEKTRQAAGEKIANRRRVIVIEQRGLGNTADSPLLQAIPPEIVGQRDLLLIDIRERIKDSVVTAPEVALERINVVKRELENRTSGRDPADIDVVYGGLLPVPFTFLTGMLLDDEGRIIVMDWDRNSDAWRQLDGVDDGDRFSIPQLPEKVGHEMVLALSTSYEVDLKQIRQVFPQVPLVHLLLASRSTECHWSIEKQRALAQQFLETVKQLAEQGVETIHVIIAAPNSLVFRFGRIYDKRNLPTVFVYQYERSSLPAYPWGVRLPTHGVERSEIIRTILPRQSRSA